MIDGYKELTPVIYGENAIKYLYTEQKKAEGEICFLLHWHDRMELTYVFGFCRRACRSGTGADAWRFCSVGKGLLSYGHV